MIGNLEVKDGMRRLGSHDMDIGLSNFVVAGVQTASSRTNYSGALTPPLREEGGCCCMFRFPIFVRTSDAKSTSAYAMSLGGCVDVDR